VARLRELQNDLQRRQWYRRALSKKYRRRTIRYSLLFANALLLVLVVAFVTRHPQKGSSATQNAILPSESTVASNPLDQLSSADIAVHVARTVNLPESTSVTNKADTENAQLTITPADDVIAAKPQVIATGLKSRKDIQKYTTKAGDTVSSIAVKFGVTSDTIRWSNDLNGESVAAGKTLVISPINGIVYQVKSGDSVETLASKYHANKDQIVAFNDTEVSGLPVGEYIVIPNGSPSATVGAPSVANLAASGGFAWGGGPIYGSNGYDYGYCTWWAATRRAQVGHSIPSNLGNASTWKLLAQRAGIPVGNTPQKYAVIWTPPRDYYGHVGFVENVNADGSVVVSEMNVIGWGKVDTKTLSPAEAANYGYIYY
jgi:surface antigen